MRIAAAISTVFFLAACSPSTGSAPEPADAPADAPTGPVAPPTPAPLPAGSHAQEGRKVTVSLPFRAADDMAWVTATSVADAKPFVFKGLEVKPGAGPNGTDLAVFTYEANRTGQATLEFGLVPGGQMLIGPERLVYKGQPAQRYTAEVTSP